MAAPKTEEEKKDKVLLLIIPLGLGAAIWWYLRNRPPTPPPGMAILHGIVADADTQQGIGGIDVALEGTAHAAVTEANGHYQINDIDPGTYTVSFIDPQGRYESGTV